MSPIENTTGTPTTGISTTADVGGPHPGVPESPNPPAPREVPVEFLGSGSEYFRIWIVNTTLSILTLGIYSAWAKVRNRRYFYGNTRIDGSSFEYLAKPTQIFRGRVLVAGGFGIIIIAGFFVPLLFSLLPIAFGLVTPWVIVKAARFNARMSSFRNVRFNFNGKTDDAYGVFLLLPMLVGLTAGIMLPFVHARQRSFLFSGHDYAKLPFHDDIPLRRVYVAYALVGVSVVAAVIAYFVAFGFPDMSVFEENSPAPDENVAIEFGRLLLMYGLIALVALFANTVTSTVMTNALMNSGGLTNRVRFRSTLSPLKMVWLRLAYGVLTIVTLGLAYPWMRVKLAKYRATSTTIILLGDLDDVVDEAASAGSAVSDQMGEALDIDFDLGF